MKVSAKLIGAVALILTLVPFRRQTVPELHLHISSPGGQPVSNALVRQTWQNYSVESSGHEQDLRSDSSGSITLPERNHHASALHVLLGPVLSFLGQGVHASYGPSSYVLVYATGLEGVAEWAPGKPTTIEVPLTSRR